jgi:hypothetical protein
MQGHVRRFAALHGGLPVTVTVEAWSVDEAAARGLEKIRIAGGSPSDPQIVEHLPGKAWNVTTDRLLKWVSSSQRGDNLGLRVIKKNIGEFLGRPTKK